MGKENKTPNTLKGRSSKSIKTPYRSIPSLVLTSKIPGMGLFMHSKNKISTNSSNTKKNEKFKISQKNFRKGKIRLLSEKSKMSNIGESLNSEVYIKVENELIKILEEKVKLLHIKIEEKTAEIKNYFLEKNEILENLVEIKNVF